ncbi:hypothetical protein BDR25DRAFT_353809 [Lindgomyces ingoldianus]|uniref:Uncharacterized protein n=1 Tax=Lindgomyces ingoldianus TaxID=673940 RepID=A0ACB6R157_9PLEO|nr:hypothetical protein BDR25DRAFT_353809 [Lindgomyces ingoldianus]
MVSLMKARGDFKRLLLELGFSCDGDSGGEASSSERLSNHNKLQNFNQFALMTKTYNSRYSLLVTHATTNPPVPRLSIEDRTGFRLCWVLWLYVSEILLGECTACNYGDDGYIRGSIVSLKLTISPLGLSGTLWVGLNEVLHGLRCKIGERMSSGNPGMYQISEKLDGGEAKRHTAPVGFVAVRSWHQGELRVRSSVLAALHLIGFTNTVFIPPVGGFSVKLTIKKYIQTQIAARRVEVTESRRVPGKVLALRDALTTFLHSSSSISRDAKDNKIHEGELKTGVAGMGIEIAMTYLDSSYEWKELVSHSRKQRRISIQILHELRRGHMANDSTRERDPNKSSGLTIYCTREELCLMNTCDIKHYVQARLIGENR